jgi:hypothetical protein
MADPAAVDAALAACESGGVMDSALASGFLEAAGEAVAAAATRSVGSAS